MSHLQINLAARPNRVKPVTGGNETLWPLLHDLRDCQLAFGLNARDIETLSVFVGFLKGQNHRMVFASNNTILKRMNGISVKTLQRAVSRLVGAGLIIRRDSPNGKRFAVRHHGVDHAIAFGFDLSPLEEKAKEISWYAEECRAEAQKVRLFKLRLRHLLTQLETAQPTHELIVQTRRTLRRKLRSDQIEALNHALEAELPYPSSTLGREIELTETSADNEAAIVAASDSQFDAHHHRSDIDDIDKKIGNEDYANTTRPIKEDHIALPLLDQVREACPNALTFYPTPPTNWSELREFTTTIAAWIGIPPDVSEASRHALGDDRAALAVLCLVESSATIRKPGAYLRSLSTSKRAAHFDPFRWLRRLAVQRTMILNSSHAPCAAV